MYSCIMSLLNDKDYLPNSFHNYYFQLNVLNRIYEKLLLINSYQHWCII